MGLKHVGILVVTLMSTLAADSAMAQGKGRGQDKKPKSAAPATTIVVVTHEFGTRDRQLITTYYTPRAGLPPGLAKRDGDLPPGLEKQLRKNGTLPPGLQKKIQPFPRALELQLAPLPSGYRRVIVGNHVVVYRTSTNAIIDVILNIVR